MTLPKIISDNTHLARLVEGAIEGYLAVSQQRDYERRNAQNLHEEIDAALRAMDELQTRLRAIVETAGLVAMDGIALGTPALYTHAPGKNLQEESNRLNGTTQRLKEIAAFLPHKKHRPDKILESELEHRIAHLCNDFGISKKETEIALDEIFNELGISRVDKKTLRDNTKGITYGEGKR